MVLVNMSSTSSAQEENIKNWMTELETVGFITGTIIYIMGVLANSFIFFTFMRVKRLCVVDNFFIVMLTISDVFIISVLLLFFLLSISSVYSHINKALCDALASMAIVCFGASVLTLMMISITRYVKICRSKYNYLIKQKPWIALFTVTIWTPGMIFAVILNLTPNGLVYDPSFFLCSFNRYGLKLYTVTYMCLALFLPVSVTCICYYKIYSYVVKSKSRFFKFWLNGLAEARLKNELLMTKANSIVFIAYLVLYMPFGIVNIFFDKADDVPHWVQMMSILLCFLNSCINCFIYGFANKNIRRAYLEGLLCKSARKRTNVITVIS